MAAVVVFDEQLLFGEALAAVLRRRGATAVSFSRPDPAALSQIEDPGSVTHVVLGVDSARQPARDLERIREVCAAAVLICLSAGLRTEESAWLAAADVAVSKQQPLAEVVRAVLEHRPDGRRSALGEPPVRPVRSRRQEVERRHTRPLPAQFLTPREREVLRLLVVGESTQGIAQRLGVTRATARSHVQSVLGRLAVHSRVEAVRYALFHDLVDVQPGDGSGERASR